MTIDLYRFSTKRGCHYVATSQQSEGRSSKRITSVSCVSHGRCSIFPSFSPRTCQRTRPVTCILRVAIMFIRHFTAVPIGCFFIRCVSQALICSVLLYRVSQEECARLREGVPYVKLYRYNPKHLCPKLNGYGDNGQISLKL